MEKKQLQRCLESKRSEFVIITGRRRIGKTFLINTLYKDKFAFAFTGGHHLTNTEQLAMFADSLQKATASPLSLKLKNWFEAFKQLENYIEALPNGKKIIFFDEMPWIDNHRSNFTKALEYFWNAWAAQRNDIMFIASGSATSWMNDNLLQNQGGLHGRITCNICLEPFTLKETEEYFEVNNFNWSRYTIIQAYMVMGGVPFYLSLLDNSLSLAQNIDALCFSNGGMLRIEFDELFNTLFVNADKYISVAKALSEKVSGLTRQEISEISEIQGSTLTRILSNLEKCSFIIGYTQYGKKTKDIIYRLSDFYTLFYFRYIESKDIKDRSYWSHILQTPGIYSWQGYTFELICLMHLEEIKKALGISGIATKSTTWRNSEAQIDLIIERADRIINLCEIKFSVEEYSISKDYADRLRKRMALFRVAVKSNKSLVNTFITTYGLVKNKYSSICQNEITMDALFE